MKALLIDIPTVPLRSTTFFEYYTAKRNELVTKFREREFMKPLDLRVPAGNSYVRGLLFLASVLREEGITVTYVNSDYDPAIADAVRLHAPESDLVLISCKTANFFPSEEAARLAKEINPEIIVLAGGPHATARAHELIERGVVDIVVRGEGEEILRDVVRALGDGRPLDGIVGLTYRGRDGEPRSTEDRGVIRDMSIVPFPAYDVMPGGIGSYHPYVDLTRGCVYTCAFCDAGTFWKRRVRHYPMEQFFQEIEYILENTDCNLIHLVDPLFGATPGHKTVIAELARRDLPVYFSCDVKANYLNAELIERMLEAKVRVFCLGVESSSDATLKFINKAATFQMELDAARLLQSFPEAYVKAYWIIGLPGETRQSLHQNVEDITFALEEGFIDEVCSHIFTPYPGTAAYDKVEEYGVKILSHDWRRYDARSYPPVYELPEVTGDEIYLTFLQVLVREIEHYQNVLKEAMEPEVSDDLWSALSFERSKGGVLL